jgi:hypothetical protein
LKFEIIEVYKGDKYDDTAITQIYFDGIIDNKEPLLLSPSETGEFSRHPKEEEHPYYEYTPNGQFYFFESSASPTTSPWSALVAKEITFTATSSLAPAGNIRYDAQNLSIGSRAVTWCEGVDGDGIGESVTMSITTKTDMIERDRIFRITSLMIVNGYAKDQTTWQNNGRVKTLRLYVGDRYWCDLHLADIIKPQIFEFPSFMHISPAVHGKEIPAAGIFAEIEYGDDNVPVYRTDLKFEIIEVYRGNKYDDTCITGIAIDVWGGIG